MLQRDSPSILAGLDDIDWIEIFLKMKPAEEKDQLGDLNSIFSSMVVSQ